jgi:L-ascorbate metabolism protein UlaG (beta-lactamase superfamily)
VIALAGVFDYSGEEDFFAGFIESIGSFMGGTPDQVPDNWAAASAITWVKGNEPPFLLVHGEADTNVTAHQSEKFAAALETVGSEAELVLLPGIDHYNSVTDRKVFEAMQSFLEQLETTDTSNTAADTDSSFEGVRVTFISTAGFLITVGDQRILIDAIYQGYPGGVLKPILEGQPPFDGVDLILATHEHLDHFDPELVLQYLQNNPETEFASTQNAVEAILALDSSMRTRLTTIDLNVGEQEQRAVADINLEAMYLSHGMPGIQNLGYILTIDDITIFHTGDMDPSSVSISDLQDYGLPEKQLDIAFIPEFLFVIEEFHAHILEGIPAEYLIPMDFGYEPLPPEIDNIFPNMIIFRETYENWELPK